MIDEWHAGAADRVYKAQRALLGGQHLIVVTYYEAAGDASVRMSFARTGNLPTPTHTATPKSYVDGNGDGYAYGDRYADPYAHHNDHAYAHHDGHGDGDPHRFGHANAHRYSYRYGHTYADGHSNIGANVDLLPLWC